MIGDFKCDCKPGYEGVLCENNTNECASSPCQNNGKCIDLTNDFRCDCSHTGFEGRFCEINFNECASAPCSNAARACEDLVLNYTCHCYPGFVGRFCEVDIKECEPNPCLNDGICFEKSDESLYNNINVSSPFHAETFDYSRAAGYVCQCPTGFTGNNCQVNINDCDQVTCPKGHVCVDLINNYECRCPPGWGGQNCERNVDSCSSQPCHNNATCTDSPNGYICNCQPGWTGQVCDTDIDECAKPRTPCEHGICQNSYGSYQCYCSLGELFKRV